MCIPKLERSETARRSSSTKWLRRLFASDIAMLQLAGLQSICSVLIGDFNKPNRWETVFYLKGLMPIAIFIYFQCLAVVKMWSVDRDYAISLFALLFDSILCAIKGIRLLTKREELRDILKHLRLSWQESVNSTIGNHVAQSAKGTSLLCKLYIRITVIFAIAYAIRPYLLLSHYYVFLKKTNVSYDSSQTIYPITYPFPINTMSTYVIVIVAEQITMTFNAIYWLSCDVMFAKLCTHGVIKFRVLSNDLEHIGIAEGDERLAIHRLSMIAKRHLESLELEIKQPSQRVTYLLIVTRKSCISFELADPNSREYKIFSVSRYCKKINGIYNPIIFLAILFTGANLCICAFQFDKELSRSNYAEAIKHLLHAITVAIQFSIYCSHAEKVTGESILMAKAAYNCSWTDRCQEFKTIILILLLRAQGSFSFNGYGFFSINVAQITRVTNTALSYFALLKTIA